MALDMQKSVQQIKNSDVIIHSMADSIILQKEEIITSSWTTSIHVSANFCFVHIISLILSNLSQRL